MKEILKYILYALGIAAFFLFSFDYNLIGSLVLIVILLTSCYSNGWKSTLFVATIFGLLTISAWISYKLVKIQVIGSLLALVIFLLLIVLTAIVCLYFYCKYPNYQRIRLKWVLEKFKNAGFERKAILVDNVDKQYYGEKLMRQDIELEVVYLEKGLKIEDDWFMDSIACFDMNKVPIFNIRASSAVEAYKVDAAIANLDKICSKKVKISD